MKKFISLLLILALSLSMLSGCSNNEASQPSGENESEQENQEPEEVITIRVGHTLQESTPSHIMFLEGFKPYVEENSNGRIEVELYPNSSLGSERVMTEGVQLETLEIAYVTTAVLANFDEKFLVFDLPFLFNNADIARQALDGELGDEVAKGLESVDLKVLGYPENGFRNVTNDRGPIYTPEDLKGIKIRTMENPIHMRSFELIGASPTPMAFTELYTGLQQGTVDAQENPVFLIYSSKFYEVQDYLSLTGHVYAPGVAVTNVNFWDSLPEDLQQVVQEGMDVAIEMQRDLLDKQNKEDLEKLKGLMEVNELTAEQKAKFVEATLPIYDELAEQIGQDLVNLAKEANNKYK
jgi:tripartite ATP-independent transporter DctP family solute receptor